MIGQNIKTIKEIIKILNKKYLRNKINKNLTFIIRDNNLFV